MKYFRHDAIVMTTGFKDEEEEEEEELHRSVFNEASESFQML